MPRPAREPDPLSGSCWERWAREPVRTCPLCGVEVSEEGACETCVEEDERNIQADAANALAEER